MKKIRYSFFLVLLSYLCSCTSDEQLQKNNYELTKVTAILPDWNLEDNKSRTSITTGSYPTKPQAVWVTGDSIGIYPDNGGDQLSFRINKGGEKTCSFDGGGWAMKSSSYTAYSPFKRSFYYEEKNALPISMLGQTQNGNDNADHLGAYDIQIAKGEKPEEGSLIFQFSRYVALARLEITAPKAATWSSVTLESDALFTTEATMNLVEEVPTVTPLKTSNSVTLQLTNVTTTDNPSIIAYLTLLPVDLTDKTLAVKLTDSENNTYSSNATITNNQTNFIANAARWITASFEETIPNNQIWYTSTDGNIVTPFSTANFGATIKSNTYENGKGIITFDGDVTSIGRAAFDNCNSLLTISLPRSITEIGEEAFYQCTALTSVHISNGLRTICKSAFIACTSLTNIVIPNSVTTIEEYAFSDCTSIISINIPESVTNIGKNIFLGCTSLTNIIVEQNNSVYDSRENCNAIIETASNTLINGCKNTIIPNNVTAIGEYAFYNCTSLENISIPNSVTTIANNAFAHCTSLTNVIIPYGTTTIGDKAFRGCTSLTNISISNSVTSIGEQSFEACYSLSTISLPNSLITIGKNAFLGCRTIERIKIPNSISSINSSAFAGCLTLSRVDVEAIIPPILSNTTFNNCSNDLKIYVPAESLEAYKAADYWKELNLMTETIPNNQIWYTTSDKKELSLTYAASFGATWLSNTYTNDKGIINFDASITEIGGKGFMNCTNITNITIPNTVTSICGSAFNYCTSLESIILPNKITNINGKTFYKCTSLKDITIPETVTSFVGQEIFANCTSLETINLPQGITSINIKMFDNCTSLKTINIPKNVTTIADFAFRNCTALTSIEIPQDVSSIGTSAFFSCKNLKTVYCKSINPPTLGQSAFTNVSPTIYVPKGSVNSYKSASEWSDLADYIQGYDF